MARVRYRCCWKAKILIPPSGFSPDGRRLAYSDSSPTAISIFGPCPSIPAIRSTLNPVSLCRSSKHRRSSAGWSSLPTAAMLPIPQMSPGAIEIYVRPAPGPDGKPGPGKWQVSTGGGLYPEWSPNGRELFYRSLRRPHHGHGLHGDRRLVLLRQTPRVVRPADPGGRDLSELRPCSGWQAFRGVSDARNNGRGQGRGPRDVPAEFLRRTAAECAGGRRNRMPLSTGTRLGPYEILAPIGAGGMGEVYRARDTKLDREVAIKVLPAALAQDPRGSPALSAKPKFSLR